MIIRADNPGNARSVRYALAHAGIVAAHVDGLTVIAAAYWPNVAEVDETVSGHAATCPLCHETFAVPGDSTGALINCSGCPWQGFAGAIYREGIG